MDPIVNEESVIETPIVEEVVTEPKPQPGDKTESALLLKSLQEEREKRRILESELEEAKRNVQPQGDVFSDEGKVLDGKIAKLEAELKAEKEAKRLSTLHATYPALKDKQDEFTQYLEDNQGMGMEIAAKAFLIEKDLYETPKARKGLESASGGGRTPVQTGMTAEEIDNLRVNNYNEYARRIRLGTLK